MRSKFDSPAKVKDGVVEACGPLEWATGEVEALVTVTITQKGDKITGMASSPPSFPRGDNEWMLSVPAATTKKFKNGPAHAAGMVCATGDDEVAVFTWSEDIELEKVD